ncbi:glycine--tRNA ligase subunit beta [Rhodobacteraceae bacterium N5(2021)]|uniref:Glycine--tRNA ligase beta subunit n=1 Tax=Gymnodinialimonas phycosphaerae TaxID=2841589 RepID=A0A975TXV9_9RHOB|nr:glycine--tRNA ligase subunit beta [Gymnodinialimonas phycosphaerae]MBY4892581.1 glycine--tRNA ligase subunit beta [Gymnodinialimonas phycosphaerae]
MPDLLLELFSEEIPARMQARAAADLKRLVTDGLVEAGLTYASAGTFVTPRRLVLALEGLNDASPTTVEERRGPKVGAPEKALEGFLRGAGVARGDLEEREEKKGSFYYAKVTTQGRPAADIIADVIPQVIRNFPWPKSMRWGTGSLRWVRPLQSILCLLTREDGAEVVPFDVDGIAAGNTTEGHRFMAPGRFTVSSFEDYSAKLRAAKVVLSAQDRSDAIWHDATNMAFAAGLEVVEDAGLLAEVAGLVEWPVVLMGEIAEDFLGLPAEVLQTSMREHQKFFSVRNPATGRIERFITVANRETADHGETIIAGNAKVLFARLADGKFFWDNDLRVARDGMDAWRKALENVTFERRLGSQAERVERIAALAREIASMVGADPTAAETAARIAKADLSSEMVFEFPELQGTMGKYYALEAGLDPAIAAVAEEHYAPLGPTDDVPTAPLSVAVALADKLDLLTGFWAIDEKPTGSKDPFALRRAALGVIRIVLSSGHRVELFKLIKSEVSFRFGLAKFGSEKQPFEKFARAAHAEGYDFISDEIDEYFERISPEIEEDIVRDAKKFVPEISQDLLAFFHDRLKVHLKAENIRHDVIDAALSMPPTDDLTLVVARARALQAFLDTPDGENLIQGYKRSANILAQAEQKDGVEYRYGADVKYAETDEERALFAALEGARKAIAPALAEERFEDAMTEMAKLRAPIDAFFEAVQVNADNDIIRRNRLNLLHDIAEICGSVADLGKIEG